jgi:biopolymer transport protein ExbB
MLISWNQWLFELGQFFQTGGWVLYAILVVCVVLTTLLLERLSFRLFVYKGLKSQVKSYANSSADWRRKMSSICDLDLSLKGPFPLIKTLIALCPLIGLLGTVTGMIQVFDSLALYGTGNPRIMAAGVASATLPTMTGMAVAVVGLLVNGRLQQWADKERQELHSLKLFLYQARS